jgi:hypothetical protein
VIYRDKRFKKARGMRMGIPGLKKTLIKSIIIKVEYYLYGENWNAVIF